MARCKVNHGGGCFPEEQKNTETASHLPKVTEQTERRPQGCLLQAGLLRRSDTSLWSYPFPEIASYFPSLSLFFLFLFAINQAYFSLGLSGASLPDHPVARGSDLFLAFKTHP